MPRRAEDDVDQTGLLERASRGDPEAFGVLVGARLARLDGVRESYRAAAMCLQDPVMVVAVLANAEHDVETTAGNLWDAAGPD